MSSASSSPTDAPTEPASPLAAWRRHFVTALAAAAVASSALAAWALRPLPRLEVQEPAAPTLAKQERPPDAVAAVDRRVFEKSLWVNFPKPGAADAAAAEAAKPKELPLEVELVGVSEVDGMLVAALYDRRADRLVLVKSGESIAGATVAEVTKDQVTLKRGAEQKVLVRRRPGP